MLDIDDDEPRAVRLVAGDANARTSVGRFIGAVDHHLDVAGGAVDQTHRLSCLLALVSDKALRRIRCIPKAE